MDFPFRLPQPATEQDGIGRTSLSPPDYEGIYLVRACGLRTSDHATMGVALGELIPPAPDTHLVGLRFTDNEFLHFCPHGARMKVEDLCAFHEGSVPHIFSDVFIVTGRHHGNKPVALSSVLPQPSFQPVQAPLSRI